MAFENLYKRHSFVGTNMSVLKKTFPTLLYEKKSHCSKVNLKQDVLLLLFCCNISMQNREAKSTYACNTERLI